MPRTGKIKPRQIAPDPIYNSVELAKLINRIMKDGKKSIAQRQVYEALDIIKQKTKKEPLDVFKSAIRNITPQMMVRSRRVGGATYQVPMPVKGPRSFSLAIRWLVIESRALENKNNHTYSQKLATEIIAAAQGEGNSVSRKLNAHKQAEANKAFAHFRW